MRYLVTGGAGFIGSHLTELLVADGHDIVILDDLSTGLRENVAFLLDGGDVRLVEGSVTDRDLVDELMGGVDVCVHLASIVGVQLILDDVIQHERVGGWAAALVAGAA